MVKGKKKERGNERGHKEAEEHTKCRPPSASLLGLHLFWATVEFGPVVFRVGYQQNFKFIPSGYKYENNTHSYQF
jgi:hypothetical protein